MKNRRKQTEDIAVSSNTEVATYIGSTWGNAPLCWWSIKLENQSVQGTPIHRQQLTEGLMLPQSAFQAWNHKM